MTSRWPFRAKSSASTMRWGAEKVNGLYGIRYHKKFEFLRVIQSRSGLHRDHALILNSEVGLARPMSGHRPDFHPSLGFVLSLL